MPHVVTPCHSCKRPGLSPQLLVSGRPCPSYCRRSELGFGVVLTLSQKELRKFLRLMYISILNLRTAAKDQHLCIQSYTSTTLLFHFLIISLILYPDPVQNIHAQAIAKCDCVLPPIPHNWCFSPTAWPSAEWQASRGK